MFIRKMGRRFLILHSYRDGRGKVCQRRLGHYLDAASLDRLLAGFPQRFPEVELGPLRSQAEARLNGEGRERNPQERGERIRLATRALLTLLAEEKDAEALSLAAADLSQLRARLSEPVVEFEGRMAEADEHIAASNPERAEAALRDLVQVTRSQLSPRRQRLDPSEIEARPYMQAMDRLSELLRGQDRLQESAEVMGERLHRCPTSRARLIYGSVLQQLGRGREALEQYSRLANGEADRHYNSAAAAWQEGRADEALVHLLRGFSRAPQVVVALARMEAGKPVWRGGEYWQEFGPLWTEAGRRFARWICSQHLVRRRLRLALEQRVQVRNLVPASSRVWLLQRGLAAIIPPKTPAKPER